MTIQEIYDLVKQAIEEDISIVPLKISRDRKTKAREFLNTPLGRARIVDENIRIEYGKNIYVYTVHMEVELLAKFIMESIRNGWKPE